MPIYNGAFNEKLYMIELRQLALNALATADVVAKLCAVAAIGVGTAVDAAANIGTPDGLPGRPTRPNLIAATSVPRRGIGSREGRAALIHALAHIEFNAINLALDVVWRFANMPPNFYREWMQVAREEALHFSLLQAHLKTLGFDYGDFPAHNGLWEMAEKTKTDVLARLALVPRTLEARGLDASPPMRDKLLAVGDTAAAAIIDIILRDEIRHVAVGNFWYRHICSERNLDPIATYATLAAQYDAPRLRGPFNREARLAAGFEQAEIDALMADAPSTGTQTLPT